MQVKKVMTKGAEYISSKTTLTEAAKKMAHMDSGFLPIGDSKQGKLKGVITDRDIVIRAVAEGSDPNKTTVKDARTAKVLYCYEDDDIEQAANSMRKQQVYRLIVLDNSESKRMTGIITLGDIVRQGEETLSGKTVKGITSKAA